MYLVPGPAVYSSPVGLRCGQMVPPNKRQAICAAAVLFEAEYVGARGKIPGLYWWRVRLEKVPGRLSNLTDAYHAETEPSPAVAVRMIWLIRIQSLKALLGKGASGMQGLSLCGSAC